MDKKTITQALALLKYTYLGTFKDFKENDMKAMIMVWQKDFKDDNPETFLKAIDRLRAKNKFCPSIAEVKSEIARIQNPSLQLNAEEEFEKVRNAIRRYGSYRIAELMNSLDPYTREITRRIGIERICQAEDITWIKKEFISEFDNGLDRYEDILQQSEYLLTDKEREVRNQILTTIGTTLKRLENNEDIQI